MSRLRLCQVVMELLRIGVKLRTDLRELARQCDTAFEVEREKIITAAHEAVIRSVALALIPNDPAGDTRARPAESEIN